ncbi:preprotein translocase subunit SecE [Luteimonas sp. MHLX1A]|uniref:preprotein translocase subunit SecE n=1 Tax=Alterluteimonas muca TaxID=2878684 RepID=UPI001E3A8D68|nr:preprotein translocase subunit SecE [Luteimonas sp. MHLX1A]
MNSRVEQSKTASAADIVKYAVSILLVVAGLFAFYWFSGQWPGFARILAVVAGVAAGTAVFMMSTAKGAQTREFFAETRFELRKVVWPTRQEAMRMTWVVIIAVIIIALVLAGFDTVIQWLLRLFLGH